jgi:hypothetical protein
MTHLRKSPFDDASGVVGDLPVPEGVILQSANHGTFVANGVTPVTVVAPEIAENSLVSISLNTVGGTVGAIPTLKTITPGTGFTVAGTALDTSTYNWAITHKLV